MSKSLKANKSELICSLALSLVIILMTLLTISALGSKYTILTYIGTYSISPVSYLVSPRVDIVLSEALNATFVVALLLSIRRIVDRVEVCVMLAYLGVVLTILVGHISYKSLYIDSVVIVAVETTISIGLLAYFVRVRRFSSLKAVLRRSLYFVVLALFIVESFGLIYQTLLCLGVDMPIVRVFRFYDMIAFYAFYLLNSPLLTLFLFSWTLLPLMGNYRVEFENFQVKTRLKRVNSVLNRHVEVISLIVGLFYAILLGSTPYLPWLNPTGKYVGVDAVVRYHPHLMRMVRGEGLAFAISSDRPLFYAITYYLAKVFGVKPLIRAMPLVCNVMFTIATFIFAKTLFNNRWLVALATVLTPASINTTMAIFAGLYANWTAYTLGFLSFSLILRSEKKIYLLPLGILLFFATAGTHPYQWAVMMVVLTLYTMMQLGNIIKKKRANKLFIACLVTILTTSAFTAFILLNFKDVRRVLYSYGRRLPVSFYRRLGNFNYFNEQWWESMFLFTYNYGIGAFINLPAHVLSTLGFLRYKFKYDKLLIAWLMAISALAFIVPYNRYMYALPFHLYLALGVYFVFTLFMKFDHGIALIVVLSLTLVQLNYAIRYVLWTSRTLF